ncbi:LLM class flavin-dependent oxidoreductase [Streptomyces sp. NEAU-YJ-81]|uniref:LLM class flavin-dependent oxidoreductase n=1 Tax=Streptomyces sp. NEAU-YJ-81 TaxID=2820288 RepID=UPI001ABC98CD|nr:LLM class flavin-dependent oxidoreductase [Streptomyces sp. NEAU-YJ-81]MBO3675094.1 LLM class flavin-dependent oxidoreductase [Streptomyces sp. NEAU-YJ-81]
MQFSLFIVGQLASPTPERERRMLRNSVEQAVLADEVGFDRVWAVEHHGLKWYSHMSASEIFLSWVAARTSRIRIGHGVVTMPFGYQHPVRVAERAAMLDVLSGGRVDIGAGRGAGRQEMSLYGVKPEDTRPQLEEALRIFGSAWQKEQFEWHGSIDIGPGAILPRPLQAPHPPLFMACSKKETLKLAADFGVGALVLGFAGPDMVRTLRRTYDAALAARTGQHFVSSHANDHFAVVCPTVVLDDADRARTIGVRGQQFFVESARHWYGNGPVPQQDTNGDGGAALAHTKEEVVHSLHESGVPLRPEYVGSYNTEHAYGTAETAIAHVERIAETGVDEVICLIQMGTVPQEACLETIRQWGEKIIPHFRRNPG